MVWICRLRLGRNGAATETAAHHSPQIWHCSLDCSSSWWSSSKAIAEIHTHCNTRQKRSLVAADYLLACHSHSTEQANRHCTVWFQSRVWKVGGAPPLLKKWPIIKWIGREALRVNRLEPLRLWLGEKIDDSCDYREMERVIMWCECASAAILDPPSHPLEKTSLENDWKRGSPAPVHRCYHHNRSMALNSRRLFTLLRCDRLQPGPKRLFRMSNYQGKRGSILIGNGLSRLESYKPRPFKRSSDLTGRSTQWSCNNQQHHQTDSRFGASAVSPSWNRPDTFVTLDPFDCRRSRKKKMKKSQKSARIHL